MIDLKQDNFPGYEKYKNINVIEFGGIKSVLVNGGLYMSWPCSDEVSQRMAIVQLYKSGLSTQEDLARVFDLHINSVQKYVVDFTKEGLQGLVTQRSGPKESWKLTPRLRAKILLLALKEGIIEYEAIQKRLAEWNEQLSIASIRQVLLENGLVSERISVPDCEIKQIWLFGTQAKEQLLQLDFGNTPEVEGKNKIVLEIENKKIEKREIEVNNSPDVDIKAMRYYSPAQRIYLDQLEKGIFSAYAGGLLFSPLLKRYFFIDTEMCN